MDYLERMPLHTGLANKQAPTEKIRAWLVCICTRIREVMVGPPGHCPLYGIYSAGWGSPHRTVWSHHDGRYRRSCCGSGSVWIRHVETGAGLVGLRGHCEEAYVPGDGGHEQGSRGKTRPTREAAPEKNAGPGRLALGAASASALGAARCPSASIQRAKQLAAVSGKRLAAVSANNGRQCRRTVGGQCRRAGLPGAATERRGGTLRASSRKQSLGWHMHMALTAFDRKRMASGPDP